MPSHVIKTVSALMIACALLPGRLQAQDYDFALPATSLLNMNPAFAGSNGGLRNQFSARYSKNEFIASNSVDGYIRPLGIGLGLTVNSSNWYVASHRIVSLSYAQHFIINAKLKLVPSLQIGYAQRMLSDEWLIANPYPAKAGYVDISGGLLMNYKNLYVGFSGAHINRPDPYTTEPFVVPMQTSLNLSYNFLFSQKAMLNIYLYTHSWYIVPQALNIGATAVFCRHLVTGCGLTIDGMLEANASLGYRHNFFSVIGSYAYSTGNKLMGTSSTYNLALSYNLRNKEQKTLLTALEAW